MKGEHRENEQSNDFVMHLIGAQTRLYAYILSIVFDKDRSKDLVQQTNLVLLEKQRDFRAGTNFFAWASRVAFYEILADRRDRQRERHLFNDDLLALVATQAERAADLADDREAALGECLDQLPAKHREAVISRYRPGGSVRAMAESMQKSPAAVSALLHRIRTALLECVERKLRRLTQP